jgi:signal transduction histidine kinase
VVAVKAGRPPRARRASEHGLGLLDEGPHPAAVLDQELTLVAGNEAFAALAGVVAGDLPRHTLAEVVPGLAPQLLEALRDAVLTRVAVTTPVTEPPGLSGRPRRRWLTTAFPVHARGGRLRRLGLVLAEIPAAVLGEMAQPGDDAGTKRLRAVHYVMEAALAGPKLEAVLENVTRRVREVLATDTCTVLLVSDDGRELRVVASSGLEEEAWGAVRVPMGHGIAGRVAQSREPVIVSDVAHANVVSRVLRTRIASLMAAPLITGDRVVGVIHTGAVRRRDFSLDELWLLNLVASRVAGAIETGRLYEQMRFAQSRWRATVESMVDPVAVCDASGRLVYGNPALRRLIARPVPDGGPAGGGVAAGGAEAAVAPGAEAPASDLPAARAALEGADIRAVELVHPTPAGPRTVLWNAAPLHDDHGDVIGAVAVGRDLTEQRHAQRERDEQRQGVLEAISHDVRVPLTVVLLNLQMLESAGAIDLQRVRTALTASRRIDAMIQELTDSLQPAGAPASEPRRLSLPQFVADVVRRAEAVIGPDRVAVRIPAQIPAVTVDPARLERIVLNLIRNSLRLSDTRLVLEAAPQEGDVLISVINRDARLAPDELPAIFEGSERGAELARRHRLGLGLTIAQRLVESEGGRIWADDEGGGTAFRFTLPVAHG